MVNREAVTSPSHPEANIEINWQTPIRAGKEAPLLVRVREGEMITTLDFEGRHQPSEVDLPRSPPTTNLDRNKSLSCPDRVTFQCE